MNGSGVVYDSIRHGNRACTVAHELSGVRDHDDGYTCLAMDVPEQVHDLSFRLLIQVARRLIR